MQACLIRGRSHVATHAFTAGTGAVVRSRPSTAAVGLVILRARPAAGAKYPEWLEANATQLTAEDLQRYREQQRLVQEMCHVYDTEPGNAKRLLALLQQVGHYGGVGDRQKRYAWPGL